MARFKSSIQKGIIFCIQIYQWCLSGVLGSSCRFEPCCSEYAIEAIRGLGLGKGLWLTGLRILRCHPWQIGGDDPVPSKEGT